MCCSDSTTSSSLDVAGRKALLCLFVGVFVSLGAPSASGQSLASHAPPSETPGHPLPVTAPAVHVAADSDDARRLPQDMEHVLELREQGVAAYEDGRYEEAQRLFEEALGVLAEIPTPRRSRGTIGIFPHFLLFFPPFAW